MTRSRWLNIVAVGLIVLIVGTFAAIAIPGASQDATPPPDATTTPDATYTPMPPEVAISGEPQAIALPVQIGSITLTADLTDAEALASAMPNPTIPVFSIPTPMYGGATYIMSVDEARGALGTDPLLPTYIPQTHTMSQWYGYSGLISIAYTTEGFEHSLVLNEQAHPTAPQTYAVGSAPIYSTSVRGIFAIYLEQAPLGWIPPMLNGYDAAQGGWVQSNNNAAAGGTIWPFSALIWEENGLLIRLMSSSLTFDELLTIAESMTPNGFPDPTTFDGTGTPTPLPTPSLGTYFIPEVPVNVTLPDQYILTPIYEPNWRGSIASANLYPPSVDDLPTLSLMQFFTYDSIKQFTTNCAAGTSCFDNTAPPLETYIAQYEAFINNTPLPDGETKLLGAHTYFIKPMPCVWDGVSCLLYTTFISESFVEIWVNIESNTQIEQADALIAQIVFDQQNAFAPTPAPTPTVQIVNLGETFITTPMQQINVAGQDLSLTVSHINDTRCPPNVECVQAGDVTITLDVMSKGTSETVSLTMTDGTISTIMFGYEITLIAVETHRDPPDGPPTGYTITLMVDQALTN